VHDITHPNYMIQVGYYDSYTGSGSGYDGCWGTYPYLPSGNIISSDINSSNGQGRLLIYGCDFQQACYLQGNITDCATSTPISNVIIEVLNTTTTEVSNLVGDYQTAIVNSGSYQVVYSALGYENDTITVTLTNGVMSTQDVVMCPPCNTFNLSANFNLELCFGESFTVGSNTYVSTGNYTDVFQTSFGCDSVVTTNLIVHPFYTTTNTFDICTGQTVAVGQSVYANTGTYYDTLLSNNMCDSVVITQLNISEPTGIISGNAPQLLVVANGGVLPYTYVIYGPNGFVQQFVSTSGLQSFFPSINGQHYFIATDAIGCESQAVYYAVDFPLTFINDIISDKKLIEITDVLGRKSTLKPNVPLFYHYDDGKVEKKIFVE
jgi:hypothetical protein